MLPESGLNHLFRMYLLSHGILVDIYTMKRKNNPIMPMKNRRSGSCCTTNVHIRNALQRSEMIVSLRERSFMMEYLTGRLRVPGEHCFLSRISEANEIPNAVTIKITASRFTKII